MFSSSSIAAQYIGKRGAELAVEDGVDERVQRRVAIAEPEDDGKQAVWNVEVEEQSERVDEEERKPASDERCHDDAEDQRSATFASAGQLPLGSLLLVDDHRTARSSYWLCTG